jgi:hypothetical protein
MNPVVFRRLEQRFGQHAVDWFSSHLDHLCGRFFSRHWCPGMEGWTRSTLRGGGVGWFNPPFSLIGRVLRKLHHDRAVATVVIPYWRGRPWWNLVAPNGSHLSNFVVDWVWIPREPSTFLTGESAGNQIVRNAPNWDVMAVRFDFSGEGGFLPRHARCLHCGCSGCGGAARCPWGWFRLAGVSSGE